VPPRDAFGDRNGARVRATRWLGQQHREGSTPRCNCEILGRTLAEHHRRCMFFRFPPDARWNPERSVVEFGIGIGEYEGVVRVSRRVFQSLLSEAPTPDRCLEAYYSHRTRLELIAERKVRRRQLTRRRECRDHRSRSGGNGKSGRATHALSVIAGPLHESRTAWRSAPVCRHRRQANRSRSRTAVSCQDQDWHSAPRIRQPARSDERMVGRKLWCRWVDLDHGKHTRRGE
jgi:hypothetical protein